MIVKKVNYPIRVLHIVTTMNRGGLETMLMNYYRHIDRSKVQFDFLVHRDFEADYDKEILRLGGKIYRISRLNPFSFKYYKDLNDFFKNHPEYKIVHVHQDCMSSIALKVAKKNNISIRVAHSHNANQDKNIKYLIKRFYMRSIPKYATDLFACGEDAGNWMFEGKSFRILNNAIDSNLFKFNTDIRDEVRNDLNLNNKFVIGHVGRFDLQKNHSFLIDIFYEIQKIRTDAILLLIGSGNSELTIKNKVKKLGIEDKVIFMGVRNDVNKLMQAMDVFVFPSLYEGLPVTLIEAQASGLPIIKSDNVSNQCIFTSNIYSLSLEQSPKIWATKVLEIVKNLERKDTCIEIIKNRYDIKDNAERLQHYYEGKFDEYDK